MAREKKRGRIRRDKRGSTPRRATDHLRDDRKSPVGNGTGVRDTQDRLPPHRLPTGRAPTTAYVKDHSSVPAYTVAGGTLDRFGKKEIIMAKTTRKITSADVTNDGLRYLIGYIGNEDPALVRKALDSLAEYVASVPNVLPDYYLKSPR